MSANKNSRPTVGVGVLVWREKQLLLGKRIATDHVNDQAQKRAQKQSVCWQFPGGHIENGETVIECASREVLEETGLKVKALRHLGFTERPFFIGQRQYITLLVSCEYESGEAQRLEPDKCELWQWFDYQQLPVPLFEPISIFLAQLTGCQQSNTAQPGLVMPASSWGDLYALHEASTVMSDGPLKTQK